MDEKSKILLIALIVFVLASVYLTYKRSFVDHNFLVIEEEVEEGSIAEEIE